MIRIVVLLSLILCSVPSISLADIGLGIVTFTKGNVQVKHVLTIGWSKIAPRAPVFRKDRIRTGPGAQIEFMFGDGTGVILGENTEIQVKDILENPQNRITGAIFKLVSGELYLNIDENVSKKLDVAETKYTVQIPQTEIIIKCAECMIELPDNGEAKAYVESGEAQLDSAYNKILSKPTEIHQKIFKKLGFDLEPIREQMIYSYKKIKQVKQEISDASNGNN